MRFKLLSLCLSLILSACTFQMEVLSTPTPQPVEPEVLPSATATLELSADPSVTLPVTSTSTPLAPSGQVVSTFPASSVVPIVFAPNGTSQSIVGKLSAGSSQSYSLDAFQGQVMTISILAPAADTQNAFRLEIKGSDGTILCPMGTDACPFWRGVLPSTQEYFIRVTANVDGSFKMRVAINPPGQANQYFAYDDPSGRYFLSYSDEFAPMHYEGIQVFKFTPDLELRYVDTKQYAKTNLGEAYFLLGHGPANLDCTALVSLGGMEELIGEVTINGVSFIKSRTVGVGAGNIYEQSSYRGVHKGTCYEITYFMHYTNAGNYDPGTVTEFDREGLLRKFDEVLSTLVLK